MPVSHKSMPANHAPRPAAAHRERRRILSLLFAAPVAAGLLVLVSGCDQLESAQTQADHRVTSAIAAASGTSKTDTAKLQQAAGETGASAATQARAKSLLAQSQLQSANALIRQIDDNRVRNVREAFDIRQLASDIAAINTLVAGLNANEPAAALDAASKQIAAAQGADNKAAWLTNGENTIPTLGAVKQHLSELEGKISKKQDQIKDLSTKRDQATGQADTLQTQSETLKGRASVDAYKKSADLRKNAADFDRQINVAQAELAVQQHDLAFAQSQRKAIEEAIAQFESHKAAISARWAALQKVADEQGNAITAAIGTAPAAPASTDAADFSATTISAKLAQLNARVAATDQLRKQAHDLLADAAKNFKAAETAAQRVHTELGPKINSEAYRGTPQAAAWKALTTTVNPAEYTIEQSAVERAAAMLDADHAAALYARAAMAGSLAAALKTAGVAAPADLPSSADLKAQADSARANAGTSYKSADDRLAAMIESSPYATPAQKNQATVARLLTLYSASQLATAAGDKAQAQSQLQQALALRDTAVREGVTLPALPADIAPPPAAPSATPTPAPASAAE